MAARPGTPTGEAPAREARMAGDARRIAEEQAALRRVAVLVARAAPPEEVFAAVAAEAGRLLHASHAAVSRYDPDGATSIVGTWSGTGVTRVPIGTRVSPGDRTVTALVTRTGRPARLDDYGVATGTAAEIAREYGFRSAVACRSASRAGCGASSA